MNGKNRDFRSRFSVNFWSVLAASMCVFWGKAAMSSVGYFPSLVIFVRLVDG